MALLGQLVVILKIILGLFLSAAAPCYLLFLFCHPEVGNAGAGGRARRPLRQQPLLAVAAAAVASTPDTEADQNAC